MFKLCVACTRLPVFGIYLFRNDLFRPVVATRDRPRERWRAIHRSEDTRREDLKMRFFIAAMAFVLLTVTAHAQGTGKGHRGELQKEDQAKKKEDQKKRRRLRTHTKIHLKDNQARTHLALQKDAPLHRAVQRSGVIVAIPILAGLHHQYVQI
jgi:hypothetical protein